MISARRRALPPPDRPKRECCRQRQAAGRLPPNRRGFFEHPGSASKASAAMTGATSKHLRRTRRYELWLGRHPALAFCLSSFFGKPGFHFPDHAVATIASHAVSGTTPVDARHFAPAAGCKARRPRSRLVPFDADRPAGCRCRDSSAPPARPKRAARPVAGKLYDGTHCRRPGHCPRPCRPDPCRRCTQISALSQLSPMQG